MEVSHLQYFQLSSGFRMWHFLGIYCWKDLDRAIKIYKGLYANYVLSFWGSWIWNHWLYLSRVKKPVQKPESDEISQYPLITGKLHNTCKKPWNISVTVKDFTAFVLKVVVWKSVSLAGWMGTESHRKDFSQTFHLLFTALSCHF